MSDIWVLVVGALMFACGLATMLIVALDPPSWLRRHQNERSEGVALTDAPPPEPPFVRDEEPVYVVVAANYQVAESWRRLSELPPRQVRYVTAARDLRGWGENATVILLEGWSTFRSAQAVREVHDALSNLRSTRGVRVLSGQAWALERAKRAEPKNWHVIAGDVADVNQPDPWSHEAPQRPA